MRLPDGREQECLYGGEGLRAGVKGNDCAATFLFHNGEILAECDGEGLPVRRHLTGIGLYGVEDISTGTGHTYHRDEQGSTVYVTGITGETENLYSYDGFGNILEKKEVTSNRILYTGQQYDQETGQYYLRARYYNPVMGLFTQEDTYRGDGLNLYAYCANNPVMYYDPSGHGQETYSKDNLSPESPPKPTGNKGDLDSIKFSYDPKKIGKQMSKRGWTDELIQETLDNPVRTVKTSDTRWLPEADGPLNDPATAYYAADGSYVVRNDITGVIAQISSKNDPNWIAPWDSIE